MSWGCRWCFPVAVVQKSWCLRPPRLETWKLQLRNLYSKVFWSSWLWMATFWKNSGSSWTLTWRKGRWNPKYSGSHFPSSSSVETSLQPRVIQATPSWGWRGFVNKEGCEGCEGLPKKRSLKGSKDYIGWSRIRWWLQQSPRSTEECRRDLWVHCNLPGWETDFMGSLFPEPGSAPKGSKNCFNILCCSGSPGRWNSCSHWGSDARWWQQQCFASQKCAERLCNKFCCINVLHTSEMRKGAFAALLGDGVVTWGHADYGGNSDALQSHLNYVRQIYATEYAGSIQRVTLKCDSSERPDSCRPPEGPKRASMAIMTVRFDFCWTSWANRQILEKGVVSRATRCMCLLFAKEGLAS